MVDIVNKKQLDYGDILPVADEAVPSTVKLSMEALERRGLVFELPRFPGRKYNVMSIANMMFTTVRMAVALKKACEDANIPPPLVFLDKHLSQHQEDLIVQEIIRTKGQTNIALVTGIKELENGHPRNIFDLFARIQTAARAELGDQFKLEVPICLDVPNAYLPKVAQSIRRLRERFPNLPIIAGNTATADIIPSLLDAGADGIKVGVGPGAMCTTRLVTGVGVPQLTAINESAKIADGRQAVIIGDGGIRRASHVIEGLAAGADGVMFATLFAGTDETIEDGDKPIYLNKDGTPWDGKGPKHFRAAGSASSVARARTQENHGASSDDEGEGRIGYAECVGSIVPLFLELCRKQLELVPETMSAVRDERKSNFETRGTDVDPRQITSLDSFMLYPSVPNPASPDLAVASRRQVDLTIQLANKTGNTTLSTSPIVLHPKGNIDDVLAAISAATKFGIEVNEDLDLRGKIERPPAVIIPSDLDDRHIDRVLEALSVIPDIYKPVVFVEFSVAQATLCQESKRGKLLLQSHAATITGMDNNAVAAMRSHMGEKGFIAVEVSNAQQQKFAQKSGADAVVLTAQLETDNLALLIQQNDAPAIYRGLSHQDHCGNFAKTLVLGAHGLELPIPTGSTVDAIFELIRQKNGLRSAATFCGYDRSKSVLDVMHKTQIGLVNRLVNHLHL